jgi:hypothetical protein
MRYSRTTGRVPKIKIKVEQVMRAHGLKYMAVLLSVSRKNNIIFK